MPDDAADQILDDLDDVDLAGALPAPDDEELRALAGLGALTDDELREAARELGMSDAKIVTLDSHPPPPTAER